MANKLIFETSPYLLQHAHNPVNWFPWGEEAFERAKQEDKLVLISIGYSSCHWCHVMERESFEDEESARLMNENFICIKVDREERPDVDQVYMSAVQLITGSGGWPLNCFALPDKSPIFGGTYFQKVHWQEILKGLNLTWRNDRQKVERAAKELSDGVASTEIIKEKVVTCGSSLKDLKLVAEPWRRKFDREFGGWGSAPKFPMPPALEFLLDYAWLSEDSDVKQHLFFTLKSLSEGGIYDHLGGGFFRYSVDREWKVPHFEKMLYDNAQLAAIYAKAFAYFGYADFARIAKETINFTLQEFQADNGGFYSSLDADSEGVEGSYYVWSLDELTAISGDDFPLLQQFFSLTPSSSLDGMINLSLNREFHSGVHSDEDSTRLDNLKAKLLLVRSERKKPSLDTKQIACWNGLMVKALSVVSRHLNDPNMLCLAEGTAHFIEANLMDEDGQLSRCLTSGHRSGLAFLDDYAFIAEGYISLYEASLDESWLLKSKKLVDKTLTSFYDPRGGMFYFTSKEQEVVVARKMELTDGVMPAAASSLGHSLLTLSHYFFVEEYDRLSIQMVSNLKNQLSGAGPYTANWSRLLLLHYFEPVVVIAQGDNYKEVAKELASIFYPALIFGGGQLQSKIPAIATKVVDSPNNLFLCTGKQCMKPMESVDNLFVELELLKQGKASGR